jgi:hypothetical protein
LRDNCFIGGMEPPTTRNETTMTRFLTATFPNGETLYREIRVKNTTSHAYDFVVAIEAVDGSHWYTDGWSRYRETAEKEAADYQARGRNAVVLPLESVLL